MKIEMKVVLHRDLFGHTKMEYNILLIIKIIIEIKSGRCEGANWILDFLGDDYPRNLAFARRVMIRASSKLNPRR